MRKNKYKIDRIQFNNCLHDLFINNFITNKEKRIVGYEKDFLAPYFKFENGKTVFLQTLNILHSDKNSDFTIFIPKPGAFKTSKQEELNGIHFSPFLGKEFTVGDYLNPQNNYDLFGIEFSLIFYDSAAFKIVYDFYQDNFDKLKFNYSK